MSKVAIITGASSGIGQAAAYALHVQGVSLVLTARRLEPLQSLLDETGAEGIAVPADLANPQEAAQVIQTAREAFPNHEPILINAAGIGEFGPYSDMSADKITSQIQINLIAPALLIHAILPWMLEQKCGQIINILSLTVAQDLPGSAAYAASKAGLQALAKSIHLDYRRKGIRITNLAPGAVDTPIWEGKGFVPNRADMLPVEAVGQAIADLVAMPKDRNIDELLLMPPKGLL